jgi:hypothetical protein
MIRLVKTCEHCGTKSILEIDLAKKTVRNCVVGFGVNLSRFTSDFYWVEYSYGDRKHHADHLIHAATKNGYVVE